MKTTHSIEGQTRLLLLADYYQRYPLLMCACMPVQVSANAARSARLGKLVSAASSMHKALQKDSCGSGGSDGYSSDLLRKLSRKAKPAGNLKQEDIAIIKPWYKHMPFLDVLCWHPSVSSAMADWFCFRLSSAISHAASGTSSVLDDVVLETAVVNLLMVKRATDSEAEEDRSHPLLDALCCADILGKVADACSGAAQPAASDADARLRAE
jgi:hypothetical protein